MESWATPVKVAAVVAAMVLPFIAGLGVVIWSKLRARSRRRGGADQRPPTRPR
jgi:uncharacterized iron-regulated membrane protein